eukprot:scaffold286461_cov19-Tisochrysis_lutea.AAC.1
MYAQLLAVLRGDDKVASLFGELLWPCARLGGIIEQMPVGGLCESSPLPRADPCGTDFHLNNCPSVPLLSPDGGSDVYERVDCS